MKINSQYATLLANIIETEIVVLAELFIIQKNMYKCVLIRDWVQLQKEIESSEILVQSFLVHENIRLEHVRSAFPGIEGSKDFYQVTALLGEKEQFRINILFRDMKRMLLLSKIENDVLNTHISNARTIVSGMLEKVLPARRNKIYTNRGALASGNVESLVVNRSF